MNKLSNVLWITLLAILLLAGAASAIVEIEASAVTWTTDAAGALRITGPEGFLLDRELKAGEAFSLTPFDGSGKLLADGLYRWNVAALSPTAPISTRTSLVSDAKRGLGSKVGLRTAEMESGYFTLAGGLFITATFEEIDYNKDQVILDDLIVDGSACIGFDCVNGESFGFDTIRIKENNLRIRAVDTSSTASFPSNDWQITFNDSANGGANKFSIDDIDGGRTPFTIEAGAPSHSLYVDDGGRLGLGTNTPVVDVHIKSGNTPTLRLEQDGSSGFTPQTWDVAGNEANFFIRDATSGSTLPFRIFPGGAPSNSLTIGGDGDIGIGTSSPATDAQFHIENTAGDDVDDFVVNVDGLVGIGITAPTESVHIVTAAQNTGRVRFSDGNQWDMGSGSGDTFIINDDNGDAAELTVFGNGNVTITGEITTSGSCNIGCDRVFTAEYDVESIEEHADYMWQNSHLQGVGPTPEGSPMNMTRKTEGILNELEKAHIYIEQLHQRLERLEALLGEQTAAE
ncbi:MAG: hypothetical protein V3T72_12805 [Thermoanaerobaculia bacterium]